MLKLWHMSKSPDSSSTFFPRATAPIASPLHLHPAPYTCINACKFFFNFFCFFFSLLHLFQVLWCSLLCCPSLWPPLSTPQPHKFFFLLFPFAYTSFPRAAPHPPHATSTLLPQPFLAPSTPCLCAVSTPLASATAIL